MTTMIMMTTTTIRMTMTTTKMTMTRRIPKKFNMFVTCHILLCRNMSHFEKIDFFWITCGVIFIKHVFIFEVRKKSPNDVRKNCISEGLMRRFFSKFKNKAVFEKNYTALFL